MKYLLITLLIINSLAFVFYRWWYIFFVLASIVALICYSTMDGNKKPTISTKEIYDSLPTYHRYVLDPVKHVKDFFGMVDEYSSAYDQGLFDDPEDGIYPLYTYKHLPCKLEADNNFYRVYVETEKVGWQFIGTLFKSSVLDESLALAENMHIEVDGGTYYDVYNGKYHKKWSPLEFTLVILLRNDDKTDNCN